MDSPSGPLAGVNDYKSDGSKSMTTPMAGKVRSERRTRLAGIITFYLLAIAGAGVLGVSGVKMGFELSLVVLLGLCICLPLLLRWARGRFDLFEPVVMIAATYLTYFVVGPLLRILEGDTSLMGRNIEPLYALAFFAAIVAINVLWIGYHLPIGPYLTRQIPSGLLSGQRRKYSERQLRSFGVALALAGAGGVLLWSVQSGRSLGMFFLPGLVTQVDPGGEYGSSYFFLMIEFLIPAALLLLMGGGLSKKPWYWVYFALVSIVYISIGFRYRILILWVATGTFYYLRKRSRPSKAVVLGGVTLVLVMAGWVQISRGYFRSAGQVGEVSTSIADARSRALSDTGIFETFAAVIHAVPDQIDYVYLEPVVQVFVHPIPRSLWPDKPMPDFLDKIGQAVGTPGSGRAGLAVPHFGEYYLAFGWIGLVFGLFAFGVGCRTLWEWRLRAPSDPWRQAIFALSYAFIFQMITRGYTTQIVQSWFFIVFPAVVGMLVFSRTGLTLRASRQVKAAA